jgi:hypothetical protein
MPSAMVMHPVHFVRCLPLLGVLLLANTTVRAASPMQPGMWELNFGTSVGKQSIPGDASRECVTPKDIESATATLPRPDGDCKLSNIKTDGKRTTYDLACTMDDMSMNGRMNLVVDADHYGGEAQMTIKRKGTPDRPVTMLITARRVGDCPK